jgi:hypothetical protein
MSWISEIDTCMLSFHNAEIKILSRCHPNSIYCAQMSDSQLATNRRQDLLINCTLSLVSDSIHQTSLT